MGKNPCKGKYQENNSSEEEGEERKKIHAEGRSNCDFYLIYKICQCLLKIILIQNIIGALPLLNRYLLFGLTFWSGGHYRGAVLVNGVWYHYDGLWERNSRGQGLQKCTGKPSTPSR